MEYVIYGLTLLLIVSNVYWYLTYKESKDIVLKHQPKYPQDVMSRYKKGEL